MKSATSLAIAVCLMLFAATECHSQTEGLRIQGQVIDSMGEPLADAEVHLFLKPFDTTSSAAAIVKTNERGEYQFLAVEFDGGNLGCVAFHPKFAAGGTRHQVDTPIDLKQIVQVGTIELGSPKTVSFEVSGPNLEVVEVESARMISSSVRGQIPQMYCSQEQLPEVGGPIVSYHGNQVEIENVEDSFRMQVAITTKNYGEQIAYISVESAPSQIFLRDVFNLQGQLTSADQSGSLPSRISITSRASRTRSFRRPDQEQPPVTESANYEVAFDEDGSFSLEKVAIGNIQFNVDLDPNQPYRLVTTRLLESDIKTTDHQIELAIEKANTIIGKVIDNDGNPISDITVNLDDQKSVTNKEGKYLLYGLPGNQYIQLQVPRGWVGSRVVITQVNKDDDPHEAPAFELTRAIQVVGRVVNDRGQPVPGASVFAQWEGRLGGAIDQGLSSATTDDRGDFTLENVHPDADFTIRAIRFSDQEPPMASVKSVRHLTNNKKPVEIEISEQGVCEVAGKVVDADGVPIANARVEVWSHSININGMSQSSSIVQNGTNRYFFTDENGYFQTNSPLLSQNGFSLNIVAEGFEPRAIPEQRPDSGGLFSFGELQLERSNRVIGSVVDLKGEPIAGAKIWTDFRGGRNSPLTVSDEQGLFQIDGVLPTSMCIFAWHEAYLLGGAFNESGDKEIILTPKANLESLTVEDVRAANEQQAQRDLIPFELRKPLVSQLATASLAGGDGRGSELFQAALIYTNKELALDLIDSFTARKQVLLLAAHEEIDEMLAEAKQIRDVYSRSQTLLWTVKYFDEVSETRRVLEELAVTTNMIDRVPGKIICRAKLADQYTLIGDDEQAKSILLDLLPSAKELGEVDFDALARGYFAASLANYEPDQALSLVTSIKDEGMRIDSICMVLERLARCAPQELAEVFPTFEPYTRSAAIPRVAAELGRTDPELAMTLIAGLEGDRATSARISGQAYLGRTLGETDPLKARQLFITALESMVDNARGRQDFKNAIQIVDFARVVDPSFLPHYQWLALASFGAERYGPYVEAGSKLETMRDDADRLIVMQLCGTRNDLREARVKSLQKACFEENALAGKRGLDFNNIVTCLLLEDPEPVTNWILRTIPAELDRGQRDIQSLTIRLLGSPQGEMSDWFQEYSLNRRVIGYQHLERPQ